MFKLFINANYYLFYFCELKKYYFKIDEVINFII